jgi:hypothetical protein
LFCAAAVNVKTSDYHKLIVIIAVATYFARQQRGFACESCCNKHVVVVKAAFQQTCGISRVAAIVACNSRFATTFEQLRPATTLFFVLFTGDMKQELHI